MQEPPGWRQVSLGCSAAVAAGAIPSSSSPWGSEAVAAVVVEGTRGAQGSGRRGYRGHGQGALERPELLLAFSSRSRSSVGQGWEHPIREEGEGGGEGNGCGGRGSWGGRGRKLPEQQPRATSITFNFKRERGSWKSTGVAILAEGREEAPKGSRVCGGASLDTAKTAGEREQGWGRPSEG